MNIDISYYVIVYILVPLFFIVFHCFTCFSLFFIVFHCFTCFSLFYMFFIVFHCFTCFSLFFIVLHVFHCFSLFFIVFLWYFLNVRHLYTMSLILKSQIIIKNIFKNNVYFGIYKLILYPLNRFNYRYTDNYRNCWQQKKENIQYSVQIEHCSLAPPLMYRNMRETWFSVNIFLVYYDVTHSI
jgi:hypothetical protein